MSIHKSIATYLARCFTPISITAKAKEWKKLSYKNKLFSIEITPSPQYVSSYSPDNLKEWNEIKFSSPY